MKGKVYLVGAGPGDPELLTVKAARLIQAAHVVLHDALVSPSVLAMTSPAAQVIDVGKRCGRKNITQDEINRLLVEFASVGKLVIRLKSGDPLIFGRGGEELQALQQAGIESEVVPGITAAVAAAAAAQISLTDRCHAEQVLLVSAHQSADKAGPDWSALVSRRTTIVVYMPGQAGEVAEQLIEAGLNDHTPCLIISQVSLPDEQVYRTTLGILCGSVQLPAPCLLIIGETVATSRLADPQPRYGEMPEIKTRPISGPCQTFSSTAQMRAPIPPGTSEISSAMPTSSRGFVLASVSTRQRPARSRSETSTAFEVMGILRVAPSRVMGVLGIRTQRAATPRKCLACRHNRHGRSSSF